MWRAERAVMATLSVAFLSTQAAAPIRVMLLDGESGGADHKWRLTTALMTKALDTTGLFGAETVTVRTHEAQELNPLDAATR